jgi:starch phosphorylase
MTSPASANTSDWSNAIITTDVERIRKEFIEKLFGEQAKFPEIATENDYFLALAHVVRDRVLARWIQTARTYYERGSRCVAYLSAEYLIGPQLGNNLLCLGMTESVKAALESMQISLDRLLDHEEEPGLGNGGLGRLAACYMDSLATLSIPAIGYGLRYEYGIFDQAIRDGQQIEVADKWLAFGFPWEIPRLELRYPVGFGGTTEHFVDEAGRYRVRWTPGRAVRGAAFDVPLLGYATQSANHLRLWHAVAAESFNFEAFNAGDYYRAVEDNVRSETISKVLYPNDAAQPGKRLRLEQQYLLVSCSLQDMIRMCLEREDGLRDFHKHYAVQLNDTHPALAVVELMRLLVDEHNLAWDEAWGITVASFGYTNHTLLPEALETWGVPLFGSLLPRHLELVYEINRRFLDEVRAKFPGDDERLRRLSLIDETGERSVRMAQVACVGSHAINGVAELHSKLLRETVLRDFAECHPERFCNVTNGITPRRFLALANPGLARLIRDAIGERWLVDLEELRRLEPLADDAAFRSEFARVKLANKRALVELTRRAIGFDLDPDALFGVQVKRMHEYKRQLLHVLHIVALYHRILNGAAPSAPRNFVLAGKAAPGYAMAKLVIRLVNDVAQVIQRDPRARASLRVAFIPDFNVKVAERIYPAADLSEQLSTAGKEASGTGNMKLSLNGALTIGTLDGANVEIRERVGAENFYLFGLSAEEVRDRKHAGYRPWEIEAADSELHAALELIASGRFSDGDTERYAPLIRSLRERDEYLVLADYRAYLDAQERVSRDYVDRDAWTRRAVQTVARMGYFSSDRSIREYCEQIWKVSAVSVLPPPHV